jgi:hypothetical protein
VRPQASPISAARLMAGACHGRRHRPSAALHQGAGRLQALGEPAPAPARRDRAAWGDPCGSAGPWLKSGRGGGR